MPERNGEVCEERKLVDLLRSLNSNCGRLNPSSPSDLRSLNSFIESDFGWLLIEVLAHRNWKISSKTESINELVNSIVILRKLIPIAVEAEKLSDQANFREVESWYNLLSPSVSALSESSSIQTSKFLNTTSNKHSSPHSNRLKCLKKRSYLDNVHEATQASQPERKYSYPSNGSDSEQDSPPLSPNHHEIDLRLSVSDDSDGFPAGWGDRRHNRTSIAMHRNVLNAEMLLAYRAGIPQLAKDSPRRLSKRKNAFGMILLLLACIRKAFECAYGIELTQCMITSDVVNECMHWKCILKSDMAVLESDSEDTFIRQVILQKHWVDAFIAVMHYFARPTHLTSVSNGSSHTTWHGVYCLSDQLRLVCLLLNTSSNMLSGDVARECLQLLLDNGHRIFIGLMHIALAILPQPDTYNTSIPFMAETLQTAVRLVALCRDGGIEDSLRDLLIAVDMLAQVNFQPPSVSGVMGCALIDNAYSSMLFSLLLSVAGLSHRLYQVKCLWLHGSRCCKSEHGSCHVSSQDRCRHHHTVLNLPSTQHNDICACSFLNSCLLSCYRHLTGVESRDMLSQALHGCGWCCCLPFHQLLQSLVLPDAKDETLAALLASEFINSFPTESIGLCGSCASNQEICEAENTEYAQTLLRCVKCKVIPLTDLAALVQRCNPTHKDAICSKVIAPILAEKLWETDFQAPICEDISSLLDMCSISIQGKGGFAAVTNKIVRPPYTGQLLLNEQTRRAFISVLKSGVKVEDMLMYNGELADWDVEAASVFSRSFLAQLQMLIKLIQKDMMNLVASPGNKYWCLSVELLEAGVELASMERTSFRRLLVSQGLDASCLSIVNDCICSVDQCSSRGASRRLTMLLTNALRMALITNGREEMKEQLRKSTDKLLEKSLNWPSVSIGMGHLCRALVRCSVVYDTDRNDARQYEIDDADDSVGYLAEEELNDNEENGLRVVSVHPWLCSLSIGCLSKCLIFMDQTCASDVHNSLHVFQFVLSSLSSEQIQSLRDEGVIEHLWTILRRCADKKFDNVLKGLVESFKIFFKIELVSDDLKNLSQCLLSKNSDSYALLLLEMLCSVLNYICLPPYYTLCMPSIEDASRPASPVVSTSRSLPVSMTRAAVLRRSRSEGRPVNPGERDGRKKHGRKRSKGSFNSDSPVRSVATGLSQFFSFNSSSILSPPHKKPTAFEPYGAFSLANLHFPVSATVSNTKLNEGMSISSWINITHFAPKIKDENFESDLQRSLQMSLNSQPWRLVLCLGNGTTHFALFVNQHDGSVIIKRYDETGVIHQEVCPRFHFHLGVWTHLTMSTVWRNDAWTVTVGCCNRKQLYTYGATMGHAKSDLTEQIVCMGLGYCVEEITLTEMSYSLGNVMVFKNLLNNEDRILLYGLGSRCTSIVDTKARALDPILLPILRRTWKTIDKSIDWVKLLDEKDSLIQNLQPDLLCVYLPSDAEHVLHYSISYSKPVPTDHCHKPQVQEVVSKSALSCVTSPSAVDAFDGLGAARFFLMLFARLVDLGCSESVQARGLQLQLIAMQSDPEIWRDVCNINSYNMIARVLASPLAIKGKQLIEVICHQALCPTEPKLSPIIIDECIISCLLMDSRIWMRHLKVWGECVHRICECFAEDNIAAFNLVQLNRGRFVRYLLFFLFEIWQTDIEVDVIEADVSAAIVTLCEKLIGDPPDISVITELWDFVFLSHPAACTYINIRFSGALSWIDLKLLQDKQVNLLGYQADLVSYMRKMPLAFNAEQVAEIVARGGNVWSNIKTKFVESGVQDVELPGSTEQSIPDILCDTLDAAETLASSGDDIETADLALTLIDATGDSERGSGDKKKVVTEPRWLVVIRAGILRTLSLKLLAGPDAVVLRVVGSIIKWETLIALLNHQPDSMIRSQIVRVLCALLLRSTAAQRTRFMKAFGMRLLANQLKEFPATEEIAESLFSVLVGEALRLEDGLDGGHMSVLKPDRLQTSVLSAMLVCYEQSYRDLPLFWNITNALQKIVDFNVQLTQALFDADIVHSLVAVLVKLASLDIPSDCEAANLELNLSFECWRGLASRIIRYCAPSAELHHGQCLAHFFTLLVVADRQQMDSNHYVHHIVRRELCSLLQDWLDTTRGLFSEEGSSASTASSFESLNVYPSHLAYSPHYVSAPSQLTRSDSGSSNTKVSVTAAFIGESWLNLKDKITGLGGNLLGKGGLRLASHTDMVDRLKTCLQICCDIFIHLLPCQQTPDSEKNLFHVVLHFLICIVKRDYVSENRTRPQSEKEKAWSRLMDSCKEKAKTLIAHLVGFVLFPANLKLEGIRKRKQKGASSKFDTRRMQLIVCRALANEITHKQMLKNLLDVNLDFQFAMCMALYELILLRDDLTPVEVTDIERLLAFLRQIKIDSPTEKLTEKGVSAIATDQNLCLQTYQDVRMEWFAKLVQPINESLMKQSSADEPVSAEAMSITCAVVAQQNIPRKLFIQQTKAAATLRIQAEDMWTSLVTELCHPAACFSDPSSWPQSWHLDPTEGPLRQRKRLMPAHLGLQPHFVMPEQRERLETANHPPPLSRLMQMDMGRGDQPEEKKPKIVPATKIGESSDSMIFEAPGSVATQLIDRLHIDEKIVLSINATVLRGTIECSGEILLAENKIYFVGERARTAQKGLPRSDVICLNWEYKDVVEIYKRHHMLLDTAMEVFFTNGETYLMCFDSVQNRNMLMQRLMAIELPNLAPTSERLLQSLTQCWREGTITNFEYLMHLNKLAGRSFSDLMQYPIFPYILSDYHSASLDLGSPLNYRELSRPMAIQDKKMEDHYNKVYQCLEAEARRAPAASLLSIPHFGPYHFGSHYSNSGIVVYYLVRTPPFTAMAIEYQDDRFDVADRLFHSIETTWRLSSSESTTDFKELIPEFYYFPEMFTNFEGLDMGKRQGGERVNDVKLPPWVPDGDSRLFVLIHRQALESQLVTSALHGWIDLIFGYKQTGRASVDATNVFHPATYHGTQLASDQQQDIHKHALKAMVRTYGQMPKVLFKSPHLPHFHVKNSAVQAVNTVKGPLNNIFGINWGVFVGSPVCNAPIVVLKQRNTNPQPTRLFVVSDATCVGLPQKAHILVHYLRRKFDFSPRVPSDIESVLLLSWQWADAVVRARVQRTDPASAWKGLVALHHHSVCSCAYDMQKRRLLLGLSNAIIRIYSIIMSNMEIKTCRLEGQLVGLRGSVSVLEISEQWGVVIGGDEYGNLLMWDLNRLAFVRRIHTTDSPVSHCAISQTSADVVFVQQIVVGYGSKLYVRTVNGGYVGDIDTDISISALALSNLPEGMAVNVVAAGMNNGVIRLWDIWTLSPLNCISHPSFLEPIISLCYADTCRKLYACTQSGAVLCWEVPDSKQQSSPPKFVLASLKA